jgi:hypothetical protein
VFNADMRARFAEPPEELVLGDAGAAALAASPHLGGVRSLDVSRNDVGEAGAAAILAAPWPLETLELGWSGTYRGRELARAIIASRRPPTLRTLGLALRWIPVEELEPLLRAPALASLESLDLHGVQLGEAGAAVLTAVLPSLPALRRLILRFSGIVDSKELRAAAGRIQLDLV